MPAGTPAGDPTAADVPVVLELGSGLEALRTDPLEAAVEQHAAERLGLVLRDLGVPGRPRIGLRAGTVGRAVQVRVRASGALPTRTRTSISPCRCTASRTTRSSAWRAAVITRTASS